MVKQHGFEFLHPVVPIIVCDRTWTYAREPVLRRMPDGTLVCAHYTGGPREPHNENVVVLTRSEDDGATWSTPTVLARHAQRGCWCTEILVYGGRATAFIHTLNADCVYQELHAYRAFSSDGINWSEPRSLPGGFHDVIARQAIELADGSILCPVYWQDHVGGFDWTASGARKSGFVSGAMLSRDGGESWKLHGCLHAPDPVWLWEPNVVEVEPGRVIMFMRATHDSLLYRAESRDGGLTWAGPERTDIGADSSKLTLLRVGKTVILLFNPGGDAMYGGRRTLEAWISNDGCRTWPRKVRLALAPEGRAVCYPHGFVDEAKRCVYLALDTYRAHYLMKLPLKDLL